MQRTGSDSLAGATSGAATAAPAGERISFAALCGMLAVLSLGVLSIYRAHLVDAALGHYAGCSHCLDLSVVANDALLLAGFVALVALSRWVRSRALRALLAGAAIAGLLAYALDIVIFRLLSHRLLVADVLHFAQDAPLMSTVARPLLSRADGWFLICALALIALAMTAALMAGPARGRAGLRWAVLAAILAAGGLVTPQAQYLHQVATRNLLQVNFEVDPSRAYSAGFWRENHGQATYAAACETGLDQDYNVVVVVVESLSAYHSKLFSGLHDYTPGLDRLARRGTWFSNFHANGFSTEGGLIALLTGEVPIPTAGRFGSVMAFTQVEDDFHRWLASNGYHTAFFTSGDLAVGGRDKWLSAIGIGYAEGADSEFYSGMKRGSFGAADDAALVDRFLQWQRAQRGQGPYMATLLTVATHPPFYSPATGRSDEAESFREADRQIARLADTLESRRFFEDGILLIVGDHRAMTPIPAAEQARLGPSAPMRVPAVVLGKTGLPRGEWAANLQQTDLIPSLRHVIDEYSCRSDWQGRFLGKDAAPARYVVHADPMRRNQVVVIEGPSQYRLLLDGDDTRWRIGPNRIADANLLRERVNRERMERMAEFHDAR
jgi:hypothetical protein